MNNATQIIKEMGLSRVKKQLFSYYAECFDQDLKENLTLDYYELSDKYDGTNPEVWEEFLDMPEIYRFRQAKLAKLQEFRAYKALKLLEDKAVLDNAGAISALKELIEKSKLIQQASKNKQQVVLTYVPPKEYEGDSNE